MAKQISQLPAASVMQNSDLLVLEQNGVAKKLTGTVLLSMIDSHGGIVSTSYTAPVAPSLQGTLTLTFSDGTTASVPIYNGADGAPGAKGDTGDKGDKGDKGDTGDTGATGATGNPGYCWIKYSSVEPTSDADMGDVPDAWMGVYSGSSSTAPTAYTAYKWYNIKGAQGNTGRSGDDGADGNHILRATSPAFYQDGDYWLAESAVVFPTGYVGSVQNGDVAFYGNTYYYLSAFMMFNPRAYLVTDTYTLLAASIPSGGSSGECLGKLSNSDYDVGWISGGSGTPYTSNPASLGTASPGAVNQYARGDHVHPMPTAADIGAYVKPSGGIPKTDLASAVQTSLGKADAAIPAPSSPATGAFLVWNGTAWTAQTLSTWQGGNY